MICRARWASMLLFCSTPSDAVVAAAAEVAWLPSRRPTSPGAARSSDALNSRSCRSRTRTEPSPPPPHCGWLWQVSWMVERTLLFLMHACHSERLHPVRTLWGRICALMMSLCAGGRRQKKGNIGCSIRFFYIYLNKICTYLHFILTQPGIITERMHSPCLMRAFTLHAVVLLQYISAFYPAMTRLCSK